MTKRMQALVLSVLIVASAVPVDATLVDGSPYRLDDPLLWAHLILRGEIIEIQEFSSTTDRWGIVIGGGPETVKVEQLRVRIYDVIKGAYSRDEILVAALKWLHGASAKPFAEGDEVVLAVYFNQAADSYQLRNYKGLFIRGGDQWVRPDPGVYRYGPDRRSMMMPEIVTRVATMSAVAVARDASLVVEGTMRSVSNSEDVSSEGGLTRWRMDVTRVLKGAYSGNTIEFQMITKGVLPAWAVPVPKTASVGEKWLVFLKEKDAHFIPFAGVNGMLKVEGNAVIYDLAVEYELPLSQLMSIVQSSEVGTNHD